MKAGIVVDDEKLFSIEYHRRDIPLIGNDVCADGLFPKISDPAQTFFIGTLKVANRASQTRASSSITIETWLSKLPG